MLKRIKKYIFKTFIVLIIVLILFFWGVNIFLKRWKIKLSEDVSSINIFFTLGDCYHEVLITEYKDIYNIWNLVFNMENKISIFNIVDINEIENFQSDPQVALTFNYDDETQSIYIQKNTVVIFDYCIDSNYDERYFLRLKNIDTDELLDVLYSYINN